MTPSDLRALGQLEGAVRELTNQLAVAVQNVGEVFRRMDEMNANGTAVCRRNSEDIRRLERRPGAWLGYLANIAAIALAALALVRTGL